MLVTLSAYDFEQLCEYGAELEELEDSHDAEPDQEGQPSLMPATGDDRPGFDGTDRDSTSATLVSPSNTAEWRTSRSSTLRGAAITRQTARKSTRLSRSPRLIQKRAGLAAGLCSAIVLTINRGDAWRGNQSNSHRRGIC
jgi:hypothetical protein